MRRMGLKLYKFELSLYDYAMFLMGVYSFSLFLMFSWDNYGTGPNFYFFNRYWEVYVVILFDAFFIIII